LHVPLPETKKKNFPIPCEKETLIFTRVGGGSIIRWDFLKKFTVVFQIFYLKICQFSQEGGQLLFWFRVIKKNKTETTFDDPKSYKQILFQ
jgi:hypothetical protein